MKKEFVSILLFFILVFFAVSLFSFNSSDPCCGPTFFDTPDKVYNLFGLAGSHAAGLFIWLFGLGAFWFPVILALASIFFLGGRDKKSIGLGIIGGLVLMTCTGSMLFIFKDQYQFSNTMIPAGGIIGSFLTTLLLKYANITGGLIILIFFLLLGFMLTTGISLLALTQWIGQSIYRLFNIVAEDLKQMWQYIVQLYKTKKEQKKENQQQEREVIDLPVSLPLEKTSLKLIEQEVSDSIEIWEKPHESKPIDGPTIAPIPVEDKEFHENNQNIKQENISADFILPPISFLDEKKSQARNVDTQKLYEKATILEEKLKSFHVTGEVVEILPGPVITTFEYRPSPGIKLSKIVGLSDDLALALSAVSIRIVAPIPGKDVVGIEIPNEIREMVNLREMMISREFCESSSILTLGLGKDLMGRPVATAMDKMPHLLIAGATGTGKSVGLNSMIISLLYKATPDEVKLIMIDPKRIELSVYNDIPHLISPVVTDMKKATNALFWAVKEMERRYEILESTGLRNLLQYNKMVRQKIKENQANLSNTNGDDIGKTEIPLELLPYIVIIVDELSDLMMVASKDVEFALTRLAQMARAAGIHIILATQRPSADVLTGTIKANFPTRISFQVSSKIDGRIIIDQGGAESLLGNGDMLFCPPGTGKLMRIQCAYISETEIARITTFLKEQRKPDYNEEITKGDETEAKEFDEAEYDEKYDEAVAIVTQSRQASISYVQRRLRIGYNRAARLIEIMEHEGIIGPQIGSKPREIFVQAYEDTP